MGEKEYRIRGVVTEEETGRGIPNLIVRAFDKDIAFDDKLGSATTDPEGRFEILFDEAAFKDVFESKPDLYLQVFDSSGQRLLLETSDSVRWNASQKEFYPLQISTSQLKFT